MLGKLIVLFAVTAIVVLDMGRGSQAAFSPGVLERVQVPMFVALDRVRADLKANRTARR
jgi:hypothetical protein